ncbi:FAD-dependent oxidoreductase [Acidocella facilis]|uniref:FAD-dependent oxidoreductase n=1 Tax=Acidocella facilis TaxID=525 RepID=UPI001F46F2EE|nr:GMC family oxidoreductase [Acidocella facilis]
MAEHYDVIVIGSGPGGASFAQRLARTGKKILMLERGDYLPRARANWDAKTVFMQGAYQAREDWRDKDGKIFHPGLHYFVGGNSKVYGAALFRLRERDFGLLQHEDGPSPAWPLSYQDFAPWYDEAEALFSVHGQAGEDPSEPPRGAFPHPPVSHEPVIGDLAARLSRQNLHPFHMPLGIKLTEAHGKPTPESVCIRCDAFDGFPCLLNGKADAQVMCVDPALAKFPNLELRTNTYVKRLHASANGRAISTIEVEQDGETSQLSADIVVVACGALSSALLFLRSFSDAHPNGLANRSDQVGRNYMRHNQSILMALMRTPNDDVFQKTLGLSDFYFGTPETPSPLGLVQMCAKVHTGQILGEAVPSWLHWLPKLPFDMMARHAIDFWLSSEDIPKPENRISYKNGKVHLDFTETNANEHRRLRQELKRVLSKSYKWGSERLAYFSLPMGLEATSHQAGTMRFGTDPASAVLDINCKAHELDNLYVTDASFFPSIGAVNPTLTIIANALRVAAHVEDRLA